MLVTCLQAPKIISRGPDTMAKANLKVSDELLSKWNEANDAGDIRYLSVALDNETITTHRVHANSATEQSGSWWSEIAKDADEAASKQAHAPPAGIPVFGSPNVNAFRIKPLMWLVCNDPSAKTNGTWTLVSLTPEGVHPRAKMLFASARDDLKKKLGASRFDPDYHVTDSSELTASAFSAWRNRDAESSMTKQEIAIEEGRREQEALRQALPSRVAMGIKAIPFRLDGALKAALASFAAAPAPSAASTSSADAPVATETGAAAAVDAAAVLVSPPSSQPPGQQQQPGWLEIKVEVEAEATQQQASSAPAAVGSSSQPSQQPHEALLLASSGPDTHISSLADRIVSVASSEPRFFLCCPTTPGLGSGCVVLLYHCPEMSRPKTRMTYSTAKAAVVAAVADCGVVVAKVVSGALTTSPSSSPTGASSHV